MKKILYIVSTLKCSGPINQLYNIVKYLDRSQFTPYIITLSPEPVDSRWAEYASLGVELFSLNMSRLLGVLLIESKVKKIIENIQPDILHTQGIRSDLLAANLAFSFPKIATIRNFPQHDYIMRYGKIQGKLMLWRHINSMHKLNLCIGVSGAVSDNLSHKFGVLNTLSIPNGIDTKYYFPPTDTQKMKLRKGLGLNLNAEIWISSGHLSSLKDPLSLINSWQEIFGSDKLKTLVIIGDGDLMGECEQLTRGSPNVLLFGRVANVADYLRASDFFVSASRSEGMPNAVLEAMACGLPVLLSDIDPHREIWNMDPSIGGLFKLGNQCSLQFMFYTLLQEDRCSMSKAAIKLINDNLSALVMSRKYQEIYIDLMKDA